LNPLQQHADAQEAQRKAVELERKRYAQQLQSVKLQIAKQQRQFQQQIATWVQGSLKTHEDDIEAIHTEQEKVRQNQVEISKRHEAVVQSQVELAQGHQQLHQNLSKGLKKVGVDTKGMVVKSPQGMALEVDVHKEKAKGVLGKMFGNKD
jgi:phage-related minor tail protein